MCWEFRVSQGEAHVGTSANTFFFFLGVKSFPFLPRLYVSLPRYSNELFHLWSLSWHHSSTYESNLSYFWKTISVFLYFFPFYLVYRQALSPVLYIPEEKAMEPHSSALAWKIPWMGEPGGLQSMGSLRVGLDWATSLSLFPFMHWRRKWQPTPVSLPGESQGQGSLVGCRLWSCTELDTTEET